MVIQRIEMTAVAKAENFHKVLAAELRVVDHCLGCGGLNCFCFLFLFIYLFVCLFL